MDLVNDPIGMGNISAHYLARAKGDETGGPLGGGVVP